VSLVVSALQKEGPENEETRNMDERGGSCVLAAGSVRARCRGGYISRREQIPLEVGTWICGLVCYADQCSTSSFVRNIILVYQTNSSHISLVNCDYMVNEMKGAITCK